MNYLGGFWKLLTKIYSSGGGVLHKEISTGERDVDSKGHTFIIFTTKYYSGQQFFTFKIIYYIYFS